MTARAALAVAVLLLAGCGDDGRSVDATPTPAIGTDEKSVDAVEKHLQELAGRKDLAEEAGDEDEVKRLEQAIQEIEREQDAAIEEEFGAGTGFEKALDQLPLHEPPLYVEQLVLSEGSHELVVRVKPRRFFCGRSAKQRLAAVRGFYSLADERMRAAGVDDFVLVVDALRESRVVRPLARGEAGEVSLTARGRGAGPC